jgi:RNA polymerase sigma factor (sigma-70 family)
MSKQQPQVSDSTAPRDSVDVLMEKHAPKLFSYLVHRLFRSTTPREDAKDLLQTVFMRFCGSPSRELIRKPEPYLYKIAENALSEFRLRQDRDVVIYDSNALKSLLQKHDDGEEIPHDCAEDPFEETAAYEQLNRVLEQIPPMYRAVLLLRTRDGLSLQEIADQLGIVPTSVKVYLYRAIAACRAADWNR